MSGSEEVPGAKAPQPGPLASMAPLLAVPGVPVRTTTPGISISLPSGHGVEQEGTTGGTRLPTEHGGTLEGGLPGRSLIEQVEGAWWHLQQVELQTEYKLKEGGWESYVGLFFPSRPVSSPEMSAEADRDIARFTSEDLLLNYSPTDGLCPGWEVRRMPGWFRYQDTQGAAVPFPALSVQGGQTQNLMPWLTPGERPDLEMRKWRPAAPSDFVPALRHRGTA